MITLGADPELFLRDTRTGAATSVVGLIGGTKERPKRMDGKNTGYCVQEDNVMLEFNIPAVSSARRFHQAITTSLDWITKLVRTSLPNHDLDVGACSRLFRHEELDNKQAQLFGCSPDFNAHSQGEACPMIKPECLVDQHGAWRFAGGHVHIGYESEVPDFVVAAMADVFLGLPSVQLDRQGIRRELYGSAGRYRPTEYGIEYRTLSNFWIWTPTLSNDIAMRTVSLGKLIEGDTAEVQRLFAEIPWIDVQHAINKEDAPKAADLLAYITHDLGVGGL